MKRLFFLILISTFSATSVYAQTTGNNGATPTTPTTPQTGVGIGTTTATSNTCTTKVGEPPSGTPAQQVGCNTTGGGGPAGPCTTAPPSPGTITGIASAIENKWGITFRNLTLDQMQMFWQEFHEIDCTGLLQDIRGTVVEGWDNEYSQQFSCPQDGGVNVRFSRGFRDNAGNFIFRTGEHLQPFITHELVHVWQFCSASKKGQANRLLIPAAYDGEGGITNYSRTGCGYASGRDSLLNEDHADTISLYLNPSQGELTCGNGRPNPFTSGQRVELHRNVAREATGK